MGIKLPAVDSGKVYRSANADAISSGIDDLAKWNKVLGYSKQPAGCPGQQVPRQRIAVGWRMFIGAIACSQRAPPRCSFFMPSLVIALDHEVRAADGARELDFSRAAWAYLVL